MKEKIKKFNVNDKIGERGWLCGFWVKGKNKPYLNTKKFEVAYMKPEVVKAHKSDKHYHKKADELVLILKGGIKEKIDGKLIELKKNEFVLIKAGSETELKEVKKGTIELIVKAPSVKNDKYEV